MPPSGPRQEVRWGPVASLPGRRRGGTSYLPPPRTHTLRTNHPSWSGNLQRHVKTNKFINKLSSLQRQCSAEQWFLQKQTALSQVHVKHQCLISSFWVRGNRVDSKWRSCKTNWEETYCNFVTGKYLDEITAAALHIGRIKKKRKKERNVMN